MTKYRDWSQSDINKILKMRKEGSNWTQIGDALQDSNENVRAAFRRFVGAKHSGYKDLEIEAHDTRPVIAVMDIETLPMKVYAWSLFGDYINPDMVEKDSCMLSWAGKYLGSDKIYSDIMKPEETEERETHRISQSAWQFLRDADYVIGHNFANFDSKFLNTEFLKNDMYPLRPVIIDTFLIAKQNFRFGSNKMKFINNELGIRNKMDTDGWPLWKACDKGDPKALKEMLTYNEGDIGATESLFYKVRPYVRNLNLALYTQSAQEVCPVCGHTEYVSAGTKPTSAGLWEKVHCTRCGALTRRKENLLWGPEKKKSLRVPV